MKNKNSLNKRVFIPKLSIIILAFFLMLVSCRNTDTENNMNKGQANVIVNLRGEAYEDIGNIGYQASGNQASNFIVNNTQKFEIPFNKDFSIEAELTHATISTSNQTLASSKITPIAATETTPLSSNIRYKVVVYKATGEYVTERDYIRTQESNTPALNLDGGRSYIFIAYSVNSTSRLPAVTFSNPSNKTLDTSSVLGVTTTDDFMIYRKDMEVTGGDQPNYLGVVLKHKLSLITTTIDASATGYNITAVNANFDSNYPSYSITLSDGNVTRSGTVGNVSTVFSKLGTPVVVSNPTLINSNTTTGKYTISSITIGPLVQTLNSGLTGLIITPGVKYNLKLRLNPTDIYLDHNGQKAIRINGKIWMRYNLGDSRSNPDAGPFDQFNYYQFGRSTIVATGSTSSGAIAGWNTTEAADNAWNSGTETVPIKTSNDPCPTGYRVPTKTEFQTLINETTQGNVGNFVGNESNYSAAKVLRSKRNANVQLTFPIVGFRSFNDGSLQGRGTFGTYFTSSPGTAIRTNAHRISFSENNIDDTGDRSRIWGFLIRCVAV
ncbi:hypothetical protein CMT52_16025 [Elizabethkingia anophelis]|nr:hypothetical protein [Elizabethkingia anophelis]MDV4025842.1 hypothetical protein [Elizabethkingia anophelis]